MKLPSVYANKIDKVIKNNEEMFRKETGDRSVKKDIRDIRKYFDNSGYANKLNVKITTTDGTSMEKIILYKTDHLVNINNNKIYFKDILDYEVK